MASVTDVAGNVLDPQPQLYYEIRSGFDYPLTDITTEGLLTVDRTVRRSNRNGPRL